MEQTNKKHKPEVYELSANEYFNESSSYCTSSTILDFENTFSLSANKGASQFINLPSENLNLMIDIDYIDDINLFHLVIGEDNNIDIIELNSNNNFYFNTSEGNSNVIVASSNYNDIQSDEISFSILVQSDMIGDINGDSLINVQDIVIAVNLALNNQYDSSADLKLDNSIDILDIVQLINLI